ncbi:MAG: hypothetical protein JWM56_671 [Candidatus Peribacteria bacterium]|nr:hypothetical protein [Candidatus Peribacteria bacterium]
MKKILIAASLTVFLVACGAKSADNMAKYSLKLDIQDAAKKTELISASKRVAERVLESMGKTAQKENLDTGKADPVLTFTLPDAASKKTLDDVLTSGFKFRIMEEAPVATADITVEQKAGSIGFRETGITEKDLEWVTAAPMPGSAKAEVRLDFTQAGRDILAMVFKQNQGKTIGIFVRNKLVSSMAVNKVKPEDVIIISNVPSMVIANIFADDVNVGLHTQYVPVK